MTGSARFAPRAKALAAFLPEAAYVVIRYDAARIVATLLACSRRCSHWLPRRRMGASDFLAGLKARSLPTFAVAALSQGAGLLFTAAIVAIRGRPPPGMEFLAYAILTGAAAAVGLTSLYRALAIGPMGIVSPIGAAAAHRGRARVGWGGVHHGRLTRGAIGAACLQVR